MNCTNPARFSFDIEPIINAERNLEEAIARIKTEFPDVAKTMKRILKKAEVKSIDFAGNGSFEDNGSYYREAKKGNFKYKITYYYPEILEPNIRAFCSFQGYPKEFVWCFNEIK